MLPYPILDRFYLKYIMTYDTCHTISYDRFNEERKYKYMKYYKIYACF